MLESKTFCYVKNQINQNHRVAKFALNTKKKDKRQENGFIFWSFVVFKKLFFKYKFLQHFSTCD